MTSVIRDIDDLDERLSRPTTGVNHVFRNWEGDLILLGVGGKMGPTLARMARRARDEAGGGGRIIGVSRFSQAGIRDRLEAWGIETLPADLLDPVQVAALPDASGVIYMPGMKFGTRHHAPRTWALNTIVPVRVADRYAGSRIVAFSSGNVYGLVPVQDGGSLTTDTPKPVGEYSMSVLGRERVLEYCCQAMQMPMALLRLNYAVEMRYGVLVDIARQVWRAEAVDVNMGYFNVIWQGDANAMTLRSLEHTAIPARILNITGPQVLSTREVATWFAQRWNKPLSIVGQEGEEALLNNATDSFSRLGDPSVSLETMLSWIADWTERDGPTWEKPTHFQNRKGDF